MGQDIRKRDLDQLPREECGITANKDLVDWLDMTGFKNNG
jgi:hypothetical protein